MRTETKTYNIYKFEELSEEAKQAAIENLYDINVDHEWFDFYPDDFALDPEHFYFDLGRSWSIDIRPARSVEDTANHILENHGEVCESYKLAKAFFDSYAKQQSIIDTSDYNTDDGYDAVCDAEAKQEELRDEFWRDLGEEVLSCLQREYEYLTSEEAIIETIEANDYEFTADGKLY